MDVRAEKKSIEVGSPSKTDEETRKVPRMMRRESSKSKGRGVE